MCNHCMEIASGNAADAHTFKREFKIVFIAREHGNAACEIGITVMKSNAGISLREQRNSVLTDVWFVGLLGQHSLNYMCKLFII